MTGALASHADPAGKQVTFAKLCRAACAHTAEGDPNTGVVIGDNGVMVIDTRATSVIGRDVIGPIHPVTDKPIK
jgi:hypothetical protein